jgi:hypothetical protein
LIPSPSSVFIWSSEKDSALENFVVASIGESLELNEEVNEELQQEIYASRFPLGVNWKEIAVQLTCTPTVSHVPDMRS